MASDPNLQVLGAAYIQHRCYSDAAAKKQVRRPFRCPRAQGRRRRAAAEGQALASCARPPGPARLCPGLCAPARLPRSRPRPRAPSRAPEC